MSAVSFLIALAGLSIGTYLMRFAGVKVGAAIATKGRRRAPAAASAGADPSAPGDPSTPGESSGTVETSESADSTERVTMWMDRATVVLIGAVFATTAVFDGTDIADPARLIGVGAGRARRDPARADAARGGHRHGRVRTHPHDRDPLSRSDDGPN